MIRKIRSYQLVVHWRCSSVKREGSCFICGFSNYLRLWYLCFLPSWQTMQWLASVQILWPMHFRICVTSKYERSLLWMMQICELNLDECISCQIQLIFGWDGVNMFTVCSQGWESKVECSLWILGDHQLHCHASYLVHLATTTGHFYNLQLVTQSLTKKPTKYLWLNLIMNTFKYYFMYLVQVFKRKYKQTKYTI